MSPGGGGRVGSGMNKFEQATRCHSKGWGWYIQGRGWILCLCDLFHDACDVHIPPLPQSEWWTDTCENTTSLQLRWRAVITSWHYALNYQHTINFLMQILTNIHSYIATHYTRKKFLILRLKFRPTKEISFSTGTDNENRSKTNSIFIFFS